MKGEIKEIEVGEKKYELIKQGISESLVIQGLFIRLLISGGATRQDVPDDQVEMLMAGGITPTSAIEVKEVIKACIHSPKINNDKYEDLSLSDIPALFYQIYLFNVHEAEKKTNSPEDTQKSPIHPSESQSSQA